MSKLFAQKITLIIALFICINATAQSFTTALKKMNAEYRQEKLYVQFDRTFYNPGETVWFKTYLFAGNFPSLISKNLYTELVDAKGNVLQRITSPLLISSAAGSIVLPEKVEGTLFIRAYTKWMLNFDSSFLYTSIIPIVATLKSTEKVHTSSMPNNKSIETGTNVILQFFPEGGDLVNNVESRIAFKATYKNGMPVNVSGDIVDNQGNKITAFSTIHDGMGTFLFQPEIGKLYKAVWKDEQNNKHETILPAANDSGIVLEINSQAKHIEFKIKHAPNVTTYPFVYVVAQMQQQQLYKAKAKITDAVSSTGNIPTENFPAGIVQITLFSPDEQPLAERIVFSNLADCSFATTISASVKDTSKRSKNVIDIDMPDTLSTNLSIAVTDADIDAGQQRDNIFSGLLLTSDIKGYVYNPTYYFSGNNDDSIANQLDLVMMTNGWRRFKWKNVLAGNFPAIKYLPENYISIVGQVKDVNKTTLAGKEINGVLELKNKQKQYLNTTIDPNGKFSFSGMMFYDSAKLFYQLNKDKKKTLSSGVDFDIKSNLLEEPLVLQPDNNLAFSLIQPDTTALVKSYITYKAALNQKELNRQHYLKNITVTGQTKSKQDLMDEEYTSGLFSNGGGGHNRTIIAEDDPAFTASPNLFMYLKSRIAGLEVSTIDHTGTVMWRGQQTALFVDEISQQSMSFDPPGKIIEDPSYILSLSMNEIAMVKIFDPPFFGADGGGRGGAISVYLKKGRTGNQMIKGLDYTSLQGYSAVREFYSPDYSVPALAGVPDNRSTLYWNPFVFTDKNHRHISFTFYNNDVTKKLKVVIEGFNEDGKLTHTEKKL